jgi:hypothetical protein
MDPAAKGLVTFAREDLLERVAGAKERVWLVSPFLTAPVAACIRDAVDESATPQLRLLTALVPRSVQVGVLSPKALTILRECGFEIASIPNLHAKVSLVDSDWGLVGSGNLTGTGLGGAEGANVELGVVLDQGQIKAASELVAGWWEHEAESVSAEEIEEYAKLPRFPKEQTKLRVPGRPVALSTARGLDEILAEDPATAGERRYWIKSNYHRPDEENWWHRNWISDWRQGPYEVGDLIVLYLSARDGGPACCPAVVQVTEPSHYNRDWVLEHRDLDAADRWPYVTKTAVVDEVPVPSGAPLSAVGKNGQSVQAGYCSISRDEFEQLARAMLA